MSTSECTLCKTNSMYMFTVLNNYTSLLLLELYQGWVWGEA